MDEDISCEVYDEPAISTTVVESKTEIPQSSLESMKEFERLVLQGINNKPVETTYVDKDGFTWHHFKYPSGHEEEFREEKIIGQEDFEDEKGKAKTRFFWSDGKHEERDREYHGYETYDEKGNKVIAPFAIPNEALLDEAVYRQEMASHPIFNSNLIPPENRHEQGFMNDRLPKCVIDYYVNNGHLDEDLRRLKHHQEDVKSNIIKKRRTSLRV